MKILRNTTAYMAANLLPNVVNLLMLPIYTHYLDPRDYGLVAVVLTLKSLLGAVMGLQMVNGITRLYFDYQGDGLKTFLSTVFLGAMAFNLLVLCGFHLFGEALTAILLPKVDIPYAPFVLLALVGLFFGTQVNFCNAVLRVQERGGGILLGGLGYTLFSLLFGVYFVVVRGGGAEGVLLSQAFTALAQALLLLFLVRKSLHFRVDPTVLKQAVRFSLPFIPHSLGGILFMYTDKYILAFFVPLAAIGLYDLAGKLANILRMVVVAFDSAMAPDFMRNSKEDRVRTTERYREIILRWSAVLALGYLGITLFSAEVIALLAPEKYRGAHIFVPVLLGAYIFRALQGFAVNAIMFEKRMGILPAITFSSGLLNLVLNLLLIPRFGVMAAAWTTLLSYAATFGLSVHYSRRIYPMPFDWPRLLALFGAAVGVGLLGGAIPSGNLALVLTLKAALAAGFALALWWMNFAALRTETKKLAGALMKKNRKVAT